MVVPSGLIVTKLLRVVIHECSVFVAGKPFQASLMFASKAGVKHLSGQAFWGRLLASPTNIRLGRDKHFSKLCPGFNF